MSRCKTCKIQLGRVGDEYCGHCIVAATDRATRKLRAAQRIEARSDETPAEAVQPEGREPGPKDAPNPGQSQESWLNG